MKANIQDIINLVDFHSDSNESNLNIRTCEVSTYTEDELNDAAKDKEPFNNAEWYLAAVERAKTFISNRHDFIPLPDKNEFNEYRVMEKFIASIVGEKQREKLYLAINRKGAFQHFKQTLGQMALLNAWYRFKNTQLRKFVVCWCNVNNVVYC